MSSPWTPPRWPPRPRGGRIDARNASHPAPRPKPLPHNYSNNMVPVPSSTNPALHQPIPPSSTCPPMSGPPRTGPSNDPHSTHREDHHRHHRGVAVGSRESLSAAALASGRAQTEYEKIAAIQPEAA